MTDDEAAARTKTKKSKQKKKRHRDDGEERKAKKKHKKEKKLKKESIDDCDEAKRAKKAAKKAKKEKMRKQKELDEKVVSSSTTKRSNAMSGDSAEKSVSMNRCCANCGKDDKKFQLSDCDKCDLVQYCGVKCQKQHRKKHKRECKKRAAELRDEILFRQNERSFLGDCPICCLPMPLERSKSTIQSCCSAVICDGCSYAIQMREFKKRLKRRCPFCREELPQTPTDKEIKENFEKRAASNDPVALRRIGMIKNRAGDYDSAFEHSTRAAALGDADAHNNLSVLYRIGEGVEKDEEKGVYHLEEAAIAGHPHARFNLAFYEAENERFERAVKHFVIAANLGHDDSMKQLKEFYKHGLVSKDDLAAARRAHQAAVDATKSPQREAAAEFIASNYDALGLAM